jgi:hypothetical protein
VTDSPIPAVIEKFGVALRSYFMNPVSEPNLTIPDEVQEAISDHKVSKSPGPNGILNRVLKHVPQASGVLPGPHFQCGSPHPSLPYSVKARSFDLYP